MTLEVFWGSGSAPAWRVLLTLAVKGIPYDSRLLSFAKGEHKSPEMLAMNPRGKVPTIRDGSYALSESLAIMAYLDRKEPEPPLFGVHASQAGTILRVIMEHESYGFPAILEFARPLLFGKLAEERAQVLAALPLAREELGYLEAQLGSRSWLADEAISAADLFVFPTLKTLERALGKPGAETLDHGLLPLASSYPKLAAWVARIEALPGYEATYPPHWREG
jgi:glutathione S-transferase